MEEKGFALTFTDVDIREVLKNVLSFFEQRTRDKGLALKLDIGNDVLAIRADVYRLEQLFINLLDNAVKYTEQGSIKIAVRAEKKTLVIEVEDTGIGIPEEHLPRIFAKIRRDRTWAFHRQTYCASPQWND
jgi:two-component system phosphate regulon sensor histidine kinase PhoR